jgi:thermitase
MRVRSYTALAFALVALAAALGGKETRDDDDVAAKSYSLEELNKVGQFVCGWKTGTEKEALEAIKGLDLKVMLVSDGPGGFIVCQAKGGLKKEALEKLRAMKSLRYIEPDFPVEMTGDVPSKVAVPVAFTRKPKKEESPVDEATLAAFNKVGQMACAWEPKKGDEAVAAVKKLGLKITLRDDDSALLICTWTGKLEKKTLEALHDVASLRYVEPDPDQTIKPVGSAASVPLALRKAPKEGQSVCRPNDPGYDQLFGMELIRASNAWCKVQTSDVLVAVIDSGIKPDHEDLKDNLQADLGIDFIRVDGDGRPTKNPIDENGHGTHVAGTIGAVGNNGVGVAGVCWRVKLVALRVFDKKGEGGSNARIGAAIRAAVKMKAQVVNMSLSGRGDSNALKEAVELAAKEKVLLACAAGNLRSDDPELDNDKVPVFPANYGTDNLISVAAVDKASALAGFSHFGKKTVHLAGPGVDIVSTTNDGRYGKLSGTSMATPHVAGAAALILGHPDHKSKSAAELRKLIFEKARPTAGLEAKCSTGAILDLGFLAPESNPPPIPKEPPPIVKDPPPPVYIFYPPPCHCPQYPWRIFRRCR